MKLIKKVCFALAVLIAFNCNVFAAVEGDSVKELTVEEAVEKATRYSSTLKKIDEDLGLADDNQDDLVRTYNATYEGYDAYSLSAQLRAIRNKITTYKLSSQVEKISIEISVKQFFASVLKAEKDLELYDIDLKLNERELKIAEVKNELGMLSTTEYNSKVRAYTQAKADRDAKEIAIKEAYISLNTVLGVSDLNTRYVLVMESEYEKFNGDSVEYAISKALSASSGMTTAKLNYELAQYQLEAYSSITHTESRESVQAKLSQASRALASTKQKIESDVQSLYNEIVKAENSYETNLLELEGLKDNYEILKVKFETGQITKLEVDTAEYEIQKLEATMANQVITHEILVQQYNNPILYTGNSMMSEKEAEK